LVEAIAVEPTLQLSNIISEKTIDKMNSNASSVSVYPQIVKSVSGRSKEGVRTVVESYYNDLVNRIKIDSTKDLDSYVENFKSQIS